MLLNVQDSKCTRRYNTLEIVISLMYLSLDGKRYIFYVIYFFNYFPLQPFKSVHRENKFREALNKEPAMKISSMEFAVFLTCQTQSFIPRKFLS